MSDGIIDAARFVRFQNENGAFMTNGIKKELKFCCLYILYEAIEVRTTSPLPQCPDGAFSLSGDENFDQNSIGGRKSIISSSKVPVGKVLECNFFPIQFPMGIKSSRAISQ